MLDLVFSNQCLIKNVKKSLDIIIGEDSHHPALEVSLKTLNFKKLPIKNKEYYNYSKADYGALNNDLSGINWPGLFSNKDVDTTVEIFYAKIGEIIKKHVPLVRPKRGFPVYFRRKTILTIIRKNKMHKKFKIYDDAAYYQKFIELRRLSKKLMRDDYLNYTRNMEDQIKTNPKAFWKYVKNKKKSDCSIPNVVYLDDKVADSGDTVVDLFSEFFKSIYVHPTSVNQHNFTFGTTDEVEITREQLLAVINSLDSGKSAGPDGIPVSFILNCKNYIQYLLKKRYLSH